MKWFFNESSAIEPSYTPDVAMAIDTLEDELSEMAPPQIVHWHRNQIKTETDSAVARRTSEIVSFLFQPCKNPRAKILGLMFSSELATRINGVRNLSQQAKKEGVSRALISHYAREWDRTFGYKISQAFGKSPEACEKYRKARIKYLEGKKI